MYNELKQKKKIKISYFSKKFGINHKKMIELAEVFEETGKAEVHYPIFGSPKLVLIEKGDMSE